MLSGSLRGLFEKIHVINLYVPCYNQASFWEHMMSSEILNAGNLIGIGDFNSNLAANESWGCKSHLDPLADKIGRIFNDYCMMDVQPSPLVPAWNNRHRDDEFI